LVCPDFRENASRRLDARTLERVVYIATEIATELAGTAWERNR
jgi:hypothetical protein